MAATWGANLNTYTLWHDFAQRQIGKNIHLQFEPGVIYFLEVLSHPQRSYWNKEQSFHQESYYYYGHFHPSSRLTLPLDYFHFWPALLWDRSWRCYWAYPKKLPNVQWARAAWHSNLRFLFWKGPLMMRTSVRQNFPFIISKISERVRHELWLSPPSSVVPIHCMLKAFLGRDSGLSECRGKH